jgi:hypothetical protein
MIFAPNFKGVYCQSKGAKNLWYLRFRADALGDFYIPLKAFKLEYEAQDDFYALKVCETMHSIGIDYEDYPIFHVVDRQDNQAAWDYILMFDDRQVIAIDVALKKKCLFGIVFVVDPIDPSVGNRPLCNLAEQETKGAKPVYRL